jgi:hypothetical protein
MAEIKSALELALERTADIQSDKKGLKDHELQQEGKRLASLYLDPVENTDMVDLDKSLKERPAEEREMLKEGIFSVLLSNLYLPDEIIDTERFEKLQHAMEFMLGNKKQVDHIFKQLNQFFTQYLSNKEQLRKTLEERYQPKLQQKAQAMAERFGQRVELTPDADPEFIEYLKQNVAELDRQYTEALNEMKQQLRGLYNAAHKG